MQVARRSGPPGCSAGATSQGILCGWDGGLGKNSSLQEGPLPSLISLASPTPPTGFFLENSSTFVFFPMLSQLCPSGGDWLVFLWPLREGMGVSHE